MPCPHTSQIPAVKFSDVICVGAFAAIETGVLTLDWQPAGEPPLVTWAQIYSPTFPAVIAAPLVTPTSVGVVIVGDVASTTAPDPLTPLDRSEAAACETTPEPLALSAPVIVPAPPLLEPSTPVTPVARGSPVALVKVTEEGTPSAGVTRDGDVWNTMFPVPVAPQSLKLIVLAQHAPWPAVTLCGPCSTPLATKSCFAEKHACHWPAVSVAP